MKLGIHAFAWCTKWSNNTIHLIDKCAQYGVDFIEIPLLDLDAFEAVPVKNRLEQAGLDAVTSTVLSGNTDISSLNENIRKCGIKYLKECVRHTSLINATSFSGVIYSEFAKKDQIPPSDDNWKYASEALDEVATYADRHGVTIGLEPVNRYETNLLNTCDQALDMIKSIGNDNIKIHLDTYHMNIEEKSFYEATKAAGKDLIHYHLCENDRGIPGTGTVDWDGIFKALKEIDYKGYAGLENFVGLAQSMNTWVWRQLAPSGDILLKEGTDFIRKMQKKYGLT
jgi:D-psicose/D-tagatose/L-ribulose 3-epimerase